MSDTQKPHAWAVKACSKMWMGEFAESDAKAEAARVGCMGHAYPLFTKPTPPDAPHRDKQWHDTAWQRGFQAGVNSSEKTAKDAVAALEAEKVEHRETNRAMTEALMQAEGQTLTPPDGWADGLQWAENVAKMAKAGAPIGAQTTAMSKAIIDMDAKIKELK
jgi:hypothetical protein